jgi:2-hydroxychromene-2-carboxylate isomerase
MPEQFKEQGGAATMDPNAFMRWVVSRVMSRVCEPQRLLQQRERVEAARLKAGQPHVLEYFHQVEDGYSHLAAQVLPALAQRYNIQVICHLVGDPPGKNSAQPELLLPLSRYDAFHVAPGYGLEFPQHDKPLPPGLVKIASSILAAVNDRDFIAHAAEVGRALWSEDEVALQQLADQCGSASDSVTADRIAAGSARRSELGHYSGAMFYYGKEWYWGVDRLYHLEQRLAELGVDKDAGTPMLVPRPEMPAATLKDDGRLTLEVYPSLRSPYTAISFDRAVALARDTGVNLAIRPVLPMVMRGVPVTRQKGMYIFSDTAREARAAGVDFGPFYDPIGEPVRRGYSLYPWACEQGKGVEYFSAFLRCAFAEGINLNNDRGLRKVVERAGLDWAIARDLVGRAGWEAKLEENRLAMYESGLWGVPSFRLLNEAGVQILALWGQDRLWVIAQEIQRHVAARRAAD